jgi:hypothetical protein
MLVPKVFIANTSIALLLWGQWASGGWVEQKTPTAAAMYIACDGFLSRNRLAETDAIICSLAMSSKSQENAIVGADRLCALTELTAGMKAYAFVVEYLRLVRQKGETSFSGNPWTTIALDAWKSKWPCY